MQFSVIVPVFNRPDEIRELLESLTHNAGAESVEVLIIEDGSTITCKEVVDTFTDRLKLRYFFKSNTGPGDSRNFGMAQARGDYFLIFDSDCLLPPTYLPTVVHELSTAYVDAFGGPDRGHSSFTAIQMAINFAMTSWLTTGGVRGGKVTNFQPRSFNMGMSRAVFEATGGFADIHPGEDPDLVCRIWQRGFTTRLITSAFVYHKRRVNWRQFYKQVNKFGKVRYILNKWHPQFAKLTFYMPTFFTLCLLISLFLSIWQITCPLLVFLAYFGLIFIFSCLQTKRLSVGFLAIFAVLVQFVGYGYGFFVSWWLIQVRRLQIKEAFPDLFFKR